MAMRHSRLTGTEPHSTAVQRRCCTVCHTPIYDLRGKKTKEGVKFPCASCGGLVSTAIMDVDDWHQVHAVESQNHKFGRVPAAILHDRGTDEKEARAARAKSRSPAAQAWYDFAHDDLYKNTDRFGSLRNKCNQIVAGMVPPEVIDAAEQTLVKLGRDYVDASTAVFAAVGQAIEMLRRNNGEERRIVRARIAKCLGIAKVSACPVSRMHRDEFGARQGAKYRPPICVLLDEVEAAVGRLEREA